MIGLKISEKKHSFLQSLWLLDPDPYCMAKNVHTGEPHQCRSGSVHTEVDICFSYTAGQIFYVHVCKLCGPVAPVSSINIYSTLYV